jgi:hypothetical protein
MVVIVLPPRSNRSAQATMELLPNLIAPVRIYMPMVDLVATVQHLVGLGIHLDLSWV